MRSTVARALVLVLAGLLALSGCQPVGIGSGQPEKTKSLVIGATAAPPTMDPTAHTAAAVQQVMLYNVYETLVKIDSEGKLKPLLASAWQVSTDRKTYTFTLVDAKFATGAPVKAADVVWSLQRVKDGRTIPNLTKQMSVVDSMSAPDDKTVKVTLSRPSNGWLYDIAGPAGIVFDHSRGEDFANRSAGSGPFVLKEWRPGQSVELARNTAYWGTPARFDSVTFRYFSDASAMNSAMLSGDLDIISNVAAPQQLSQFTNAGDRFTVLDGTTNGEVVLGFNHLNPALAHLKVRQAINYAIDRQGLVKSVWGGKGLLIGSMVPPTDPWYEDRSNTYPFDPAKAKALLAEANVGPIRLRLRVPTLPYAVSSAPLIASQLKDIGIDVTIDELEFPGRWVDLVMTKGDYDMTIVAHVEPRDIVQYGNKDYYWHYNNQAVRDALAKADAGTEQEYVNGMKEVARLISEDAASDWLFLLPNLVVTKKDITGVSKNATSTSFDLTMVAARR